MEELFTYCDGIGCALRERCRRYVKGQRIDRSAPGYTWISGCSDENREGFYPVPGINNNN